MKPSYSSWRDDLREVVDIPSSEPKTDSDEKEITEKKVKNKVTINPSMKEAFDGIGGVVLEVVEVDEEEMTPDQRRALNSKEQMMKKQQMLDRQRAQMQKQGKLATSRMEQKTPAKSKAFSSVKRMMAQEGSLNPFQYHPDKGGTDKGTPEQAKKIAKNIASNRKKGPMKYDPYKGTDGRD